MNEKKQKNRVYWRNRYFQFLLLVCVIASIIPFGYKFILDQQFVDSLRTQDYENAERILDRGANPNVLLFSSGDDMDFYRTAKLFFFKNEVYKRSRVYASTEAAEFGQTKLLKKMVAKGVNINLVSPTGENPIYCAVNRKQYETVEWLLNNGANIDFQFKTSSPNKILNASLLFRAITNNDKKMIKILIGHNAHVNDISSINSNLLKLYIFSTQYNKEKYDIEIVKMFYYHGFTDLCNKQGVQAIDDAFQDDDIKLAELMYTLGSNIDFKCSKDNLSFREKIFQDNEPTPDVLELRKFILSHKLKKTVL